MTDNIGSEIQRCAEWVVEKHLETPAVFFLEMNKPLSVLMSQTMYFSAPILAPIFGYDKLQKAAGIMGDRKSLETLISSIERLTADREAKVDNA